MGHRPRRGYEAESGTDALTLSGFHAGAFKPPSRFPTYAFRNDQEPAIDNNLQKPAALKDGDAARRSPSRS
jgi:hypothetical protein